MRIAQPRNEPHKISITYLLIIVMGAAFIYMIVSMSDTINTLYDRVDSQLDANQIQLTQSVGLIKGEPAIVLMKNNPFREAGHWLYVSSRHPLSNSYVPTDLEKLTVPQGQSNEPMYVTPLVNDALKRMFLAAEKDGIRLIISSAYRSNDQQRTLYQEYVRKYGAETARQYVADPRKSEHATGLAVDINTYSDDCVANIDYCAITIAAAQWLEIHAPEYGLILRYPKGKESITGIANEPWHFRYVGDGAKTLSLSGLTLDEFVEKVDPELLK